MREAFELDQPYKQKQNERFQETGNIKPVTVGMFRQVIQRVQKKRR